MINTDEEEKGYRETDALLLGRRTTMYEGSTAVLRMLHVYLEGELTDLSLDAEYDCSIGPEEVSCQGSVKERYFDREGSRLIFSVENGFYKNNIN